MLRKRNDSPATCIGFSTSQFLGLLFYSIPTLEKPTPWRKPKTAPFLGEEKTTNMHTILIVLRENSSFHNTAVITLHKKSQTTQCVVYCTNMLVTVIWYSNFWLHIKDHSYQTATQHRSRESMFNNPPIMTIFHLLCVTNNFNNSSLCIFITSYCSGTIRNVNNDI